MKAEHRKELQTNLLADSLGRGLEKLKHKPDSGLLFKVAIGLLLVVGVFVAIRYFMNAPYKNAIAWVDVDTATNLKDLQNVASAHAGSTPALVARYQRARVLLEHGLARLCSQIDRTDAQKDLEQAEDLYNQLLKDSHDYPSLTQEALMQIAKSREARGNLSGAREFYDRLAHDYPATPHGKAAAQHLKDLDDPDLKNFYSEFERLTKGKLEPPPMKTP
jgi:tetratricopeptide (TPR) repeat protein